MRRGCRKVRAREKVRAEAKAVAVDRKAALIRAGGASASGGEETQELLRKSIERLRQARKPVARRRPSSAGTGNDSRRDRKLGIQRVSADATASASRARAGNGRRGEKLRIRRVSAEPSVLAPHEHARVPAEAGSSGEDTANTENTADWQAAARSARAARRQRRIDMAANTERRADARTLHKRKLPHAARGECGGNNGAAKRVTREARAPLAGDHAASAATRAWQDTTEDHRAARRRSREIAARHRELRDDTRLLSKRRLKGDDSDNDKDTQQDKRRRTNTRETASDGTTNLEPD